MLFKTRRVPARSSAPGATPNTSSVPVSNGRPVTNAPPVTTGPNLAPVQASVTANGSETSSTRPALRRPSAPVHPAQVSGPTPVDQHAEEPLDPYAEEPHCLRKVALVMLGYCREPRRGDLGVR